GRRIADIGTDHGYLPIYLFEKGKIDYAVCSDIKKGPLANAQKNLKKFGFEDKARLCLAGSLSGVLPNEVDCAIIAGMGGEMISSILEEGIPDGIEKFVLQPMRNIDILRRKIHTLGLKITNEKIVFEKEKFYIIICAEKGKDVMWTDDDYLVSPFMKKDILWPEYSEKERNKILKALKQLDKSDSNEKKQEFERLLKLYEV
ncbi:MAG: class I SAM-dependent methyltransferase, partial [Monoglobales bacterium]